VKGQQLIEIQSSENDGDNVMSNHLVQLSNKELESLRKKRRLFKQDKKISNSNPFADSLAD
jgi:hypothetical protein